MKYRKLPGHRRGIFRGASVWIGADHLLSIRSMRFREEYKRFYLRDVQAIAVARKPRFHISTRAIAIGVFWFFAYLYLGSRIPSAHLVFWTIAILLVIAWAYVSFKCGCTCRIYTAVSRDDLPSVYRTWTARKFLAAVDPLISQVQGVIEGNWAEAVETKPVGPSPPSPPPAVAAPALDPAPVFPTPAGRTATLAAYAFVAVLIADSLTTGLTLRSTSRAVVWILWALMLARLAAAILIFIDHHRGRLRPAMKKLAIISLMATGFLYYVQQITSGMQAGAKGTPFAWFAAASRGNVVLNQIDAAANAILGFAGLVILFRAREE